VSPAWRFAIGASRTPNAVNKMVFFMISGRWSSLLQW
jgi:hypothetical protein